MKPKKQIPQCLAPYDADAAITRGMIAGLPKDCERIAESIADVRRKCGVIAKRGKLTDPRAGIVKRMERFADSALADLKAIREAAEWLAEHGEIKGKASE